MVCPSLFICFHLFCWLLSSTILSFQQIKLSQGLFHSRLPNPDLVLVWPAQRQKRSKPLVSELERPEDLVPSESLDLAKSHAVGLPNCFTCSADPAAGLQSSSICAAGPAAGLRTVWLDLSPPMAKQTTRTRFAWTLVLPYCCFCLCQMSLIGPWSLLPTVGSPSCLSCFILSYGRCSTSVSSLLCVLRVRSPLGLALLNRKVLMESTFLYEFIFVSLSRCFSRFMALLFNNSSRGL